MSDTWAEERVYVAVKRSLREAGWTLLAGQPPSGSNHLPVVEIKDPLWLELGSRGAYKPDLLAHREGVILICECKPVFSAADEAKLLGILKSPSRLQELDRELTLRGVWQRHAIVRPTTGFMFEGALAHGGKLVESPLVTLLVRGGRARFVRPGASST